MCGWLNGGWLFHKPASQSVAATTAATDATATIGCLFAEVDVFIELGVQRIAIKRHFGPCQVSFFPRLDRSEWCASSQTRRTDDPQEPDGDARPGFNKPIHGIPFKISALRCPSVPKPMRVTMQCHCDVTSIQFVVSATWRNLISLIGKNPRVVCCHVGAGRLTGAALRNGLKCCSVGSIPPLF